MRIFTAMLLTLLIKVEPYRSRRGILSQGVRLSWTEVILELLGRRVMVGLYYLLESRVRCDILDVS